MSYPCHYTNLCPHKPHKYAPTHTHTRTHARTHARTHTHTHTHACTRTHARTHTHTHTNIFIKWANAITSAHNPHENATIHTLYICTLTHKYFNIINGEIRQIEINVTNMMAKNNNVVGFHTYPSFSTL